MTISFRGRRSVAVAALLAAVLGSGCGGESKNVFPVKGRVTFNGQPLTTGTLLFQPTAGGPPATGFINAEGMYSMSTFEDDDGAAPGNHLVMITALKENGDLAPQTELIPRKYSTPQSGLTADVKSEGENVIDFALEGAVPKPRREAPAMP